MPPSTATHPTAAADPGEAAWARIGELGERARHDRVGVLGELRDMFASGRAPAELDGDTRGRVVAFAVHPAFDRVASVAAGLWLPWVGKRFDAAAGRGHNVLERGARLPLRAAWPRYRPREERGRLAAFDFRTRVEPGALDPGVEVLVIDYAAAPQNPRLGVSRVRDELVEVAPGAHLGKMLWRRAGGRHDLVAYFALRQHPPAA